MQLRGGQDEHQVGRRLLQNFQQRIEGRGGEHMHLVHDVHALADGRRRVSRLVPEGTDLVHPVVGGGVQFQHIQDGAVFNALAGRADVARVAIHRILAVHRPGQDFGAGGLPGPPGAGEQVGVGQPSRRYLAFQGLRDVFLSHDLVKGTGAPLAVKRLVHEPFLLSQHNNKSLPERFGDRQDRTPAFEDPLIPVSLAASSKPANPRHTRRSA